MKIHVVTNAEGEIVATVRFDVTAEEGGPEQIGFIPEAGHRVHEVELPREMEKMSGDQLHLAIREKRLIPGTR